jgi:hypothetical protein
LAPATITWTNPAGGLWNVGGNWSGGAVPGPNDDAVIGPLNPGASVTHGSGADAVHSLSLSSALNVTSGSSLTAAAAATLGGTLAADTGGVFTANGAPGSTGIGDNASLFATNGGAIHLPGFTSYLAGFGASGLSATWQATGAGSVLDLPNLGSITVDAGNPLHGGNRLTIAATSGGRANLSGTTSAVAGAGQPGIGTISVSADGGGSRVDLTALTSFSGNVREGLLSFMTASNGGTVNLNPGTAALTDVQINLASAGTVHVGTLQLAVPSGAASSDHLSASGSGNTLAGNLAVSGVSTGSGTVAVASAGALTVTGSYVQTSGSTALGGGTLTVGGGLVDLRGGTLSGAGTINASVRNAANLTVGTISQHPPFTGQPGILRVNGNYTQTAGGTLEMLLVSPTAGTGYSQLIVRDRAKLAGTLYFPLVGGQSGDRFNVLIADRLTGRFANPDPFYTFQYSATGLTVVKN